VERRLFELIEQIFSDAHVVDIDLSNWDKAIDIYMLADHLPRVERDRLPLVRMQFIGVRSLRLEISAASAVEMANNDHVQWRIDDFRIEEGSGDIMISLWGAEPSPRLEIVLQDLDVRPFPPTAFDDLFPGWTQPRRGLARPGPDAMMALRADHAKNGG
jgi:hypothetical protein